MAASLFQWGWLAIRSRKNAAKMTTGMEKYNGVTPSATAMASAPKETWLRPSPIMEYRFRTSGTPNRAAQAHQHTGDQGPLHKGVRKHL